MSKGNERGHGGGHSCRNPATDDPLHDTVSILYMARYSCSSLSEPSPSWRSWLFTCAVVVPRFGQQYQGVPPSGACTWPEAVVLFHLNSLPNASQTFCLPKESAGVASLVSPSTNGVVDVLADDNINPCVVEDGVAPVRRTHNPEIWLSTGSQTSGAAPNYCSRAGTDIGIGTERPRHIYHNAQTEAHEAFSACGQTTKNSMASARRPPI